jgi:hypothetical protein
VTLRRESSADSAARFLKTHSPDRVAQAESSARRDQRLERAKHAFEALRGPDERAAITDHLAATIACFPEERRAFARVAMSSLIGTERTQLLYAIWVSLPLQHRVLALLAIDKEST